jgi:hypothetical protein
VHLVGFIIRNFKRNFSNICFTIYTFNVTVYYTPVHLGLTFRSLAVSLRTTRFNIQNFYMVLALR